MDKKSIIIIFFILILSVISNLFSIIMVKNLLDENLKQYREIRDLEYQLEYVCSKL